MLYVRDSPLRVIDCRVWGKLTSWYIETPIEADDKSCFERYYDTGTWIDTVGIVMDHILMTVIGQIEFKFVYLNTR